MDISGPIGYAFDQEAVSTSAVALVDFDGFTQAQIDVAGRIRLTVETQSVRYRYDGGNPTGSAGHLLAAGDVLILDSNNNIQNLRLIATGAGDSTVNVTLEN